MKDKVRVDWEYEGRNDFSSGTGAYTSEKALAGVAAILAPGFVLYVVLVGKVEWSILQTAIALLLAVDIGGGLVSNALNSCKRFYHTPPKPEEGQLGRFLKHPVWFSVCHVHPVVAGLLFGGGDWSFGLIWYSLFLVSVFAVLRTPLHLKRPVSMLLIMLAFLVNLYLITPAVGLEWLMPLLFIKIVYGHLVREEPYREIGRKN